MCIACYDYINIIIRFLVFTKYQFTNAPINCIQIECATFRLLAIRSQCLIIQIVDEYLLNYIYLNFSVLFLNIKRIKTAWNHEQVHVLCYLSHAICPFIFVDIIVYRSPHERTLK